MPAPTPLATRLRMKPSASPKAAIGPVVGLTIPILIAALCALAGITRRIAGAATRAPAILTTSRRESAFLFSLFSIVDIASSQKTLGRPASDAGPLAHDE